MYNTAKVSEIEYSTSKSLKIKKPNLFKRWLLKALKDAHKYENDSEANIPLVRKNDQIDQPDRSIQFTVYSANGGRVVEIRKYDRNKDRHHSNLYVVTNDQEFGKEIDKIITIEALRG